MAGASEKATDKQIGYAFALLKNSGVYQSKMCDLPDDMPSRDYWLERDVRPISTWDWLGELSKSEISKVIEYLQENS